MKIRPGFIVEVIGRGCVEVQGTERLEVINVVYGGVISLGF
jgi:hypothetical protein